MTLPAFIAALMLLDTDADAHMLITCRLLPLRFRECRTLRHD